MTQARSPNGLRALFATPLGVIIMLLLIGVADYGLANAVRAWKTYADKQRSERIRAEAGSLQVQPISLVIPGTADVNTSELGTRLFAGATVIIAPGAIGNIFTGPPDQVRPNTSVGLLGTEHPGLPAPRAPMGALIAKFEDDPPVLVGGATCLFTAPRDGRIVFGINDDKLD
ncbi:MAG: hypothetical protein HY335_02705, partial [Deinococcus sp.]|nr:hypothetical protein [Deinococcus sp.]